MDRVESMKVMRLARYLVWFILGWSGVYIGTQLLLHPSTRETYAYASPNHHFTAHSNHTVALTIIIPCYNAGTLLRELFLALSESNARQEVIFAIAKSSDNTSHFVHKFVKGRPKMRVLEFDRRYHAGQLRNLALPYAMGEYLAFVDADDTIAAKALQCALEDALAFRPDVLVMPYVIVHTYHSMHSYEGMAPGDVQLWKDSSLTAQMRALRMVNFPWNKLYRTAHVRKHNITFGDSLVQNDVQFHWMTLTLAISVRFWSDSPVVFYKRIVADPEHPEHHPLQLGERRGFDRLQLFMGLHDAYLSLVNAVDEFCTSAFAASWSHNVHAIVDWAYEHHTNSDMVRAFEAYKESTTMECPQ